eukprot:gene25842-33767_t
MSSTFDGIRSITGTKRPGGNHGCKLVEVIPNIYVAHFEDINKPDSFKTLGLESEIGLVVNSAIEQCPTSTGFYGPDIEVLRLDILDDPKVGEAHSTASDATPYIIKSNAAISKAISSGKGVLVHCYASISRSAVLIIAYIMESNRISAETATAILKEKWDASWPNDTFVRNLLAFEKTLGLPTGK